MKNDEDEEDAEMFLCWMFVERDERRCQTDLHHADDSTSFHLRLRKIPQRRRHEALNTLINTRRRNEAGTAEVRGQRS